MPQLHGTLTLHDIQSVEDFCSAALDKLLKRGRPLEQADREDALAYLISETWRISTRYDPDLSPSFAAYAREYQPRFLVDFYRQLFLDTRNERRYTDQEWARIKQLVFADRLDAPVHTNADDGDPGTLGELLPIPDRSAAADSDTDLARADSERHRYRAWDLPSLRAGLLEEAAA